MNKRALLVLSVPSVVVVGVAGALALNQVGGTMEAIDVLGLFGATGVMALFVVGAWKLGERERRNQNLAAIHLRGVFHDLARARGLDLVVYPPYQHPIVGRIESMASVRGMIGPYRIEVGVDPQEEHIQCVRIAVRCARTGRWPKWPRALRQDPSFALAPTAIEALQRLRTHRAGASKVENLSLAPDGLVSSILYVAKNSVLVEGQNTRQLADPSDLSEVLRNMLILAEGIPLAAAPRPSR